MQIFNFSPIGYIKSPYQQKFGIPRQSGLVPAATVTLELLPPFNNPHCVRGLEEFEYVWIQFVFHNSTDEGWNPLVRPPRLGGKQKMGVFATRSPHRPNNIGLSLLKLEKITLNKGVILEFSGADLLDGTPALDIKPYITFIESKPTAKSGFASKAPPLLTVAWSIEALVQLKALNLSDRFKILIEHSLALDPRPAYQEDKNRIYGIRIDDINIKFQIKDKIVQVTELIHKKKPPHL